MLKVTVFRYGGVPKRWMHLFCTKHGVFPLSYPYYVLSIQLGLAIDVDKGWYYLEMEKVTV